MFTIVINVCDFTFVSVHVGYYLFLHSFKRNATTVTRTLQVCVRSNRLLQIAYEYVPLHFVDFILLHCEGESGSC